MTDIKSIEELLNRYAKKADRAEDNALNFNIEGNKVMNGRWQRIAERYYNRIDEAETIIRMFGYDVEWNDDGIATLVERWNVIDKNASEIKGLPEGEIVWISTNRNEATLAYWRKGVTGFPAWYGMGLDEYNYDDIIAWRKLDLPDPYEC